MRAVLTRDLLPLVGRAVDQAASATDRELLLGDSTIAAALNRAVKTVVPEASALARAADVLPPLAPRADPLALTLTDLVNEHPGRSGHRLVTCCCSTPDADTPSANARRISSASSIAANDSSFRPTAAIRTDRLLRVDRDLARR